MARPKTQDHPWKSARDNFDEVTLPKLKAIGRQIGEAAKRGDTKAKGIILLHSRIHRSFDPLTLMLLDKALNEYCER